MSSDRTSVIACALAAAAAIAAAPAARARQQPVEPFVDSVEVNVVNVEVYVTGPDGEPMRGLGPEDFVVYDDGKPVRITNFYVGSSIRTPATDGDRPTAEPPSSQRLNLAIYLDDESIRPFGRRDVIRRLRELVEAGAARGHRFMLIVHGGTLTVPHTFDDPPDRLGPLLDRLGNATGALGALDAEAADIFRTMARTSPEPSARATDGDFASMDARSLLPRIEFYATAVREQTFVRLSALADLVAALGGVPGRKAVLYVGEGIKTRPGEDLFDAWQLRFPLLARREGVNGYDASRYGTFDDLRALAARANGNLVSFYAVDTGDPVNFSNLTAEREGYAGGSQPMLLDRHDMSASLGFLAGGTGGAVVAGSGGRAGLDGLMGDLDSYYSLGFEPERPSDGGTHSLRVEVARAGARLRYRETYEDKTPDVRMRDLTRAALLLGASDNPLAVAVEAERTTAGPGGAVDVVLLVKVPLGRLALLPAGEVHRARLVMYLAVKDEKGRTSEIQRREFPVQVPNRSLLTALGQYAGFTFDLRLRPGDHTVAVTVRDEVASTASTVAMPLEVVRPAT